MPAGSKAPPADPGAADGALDVEDMLCVPAPAVTLAEENVVGADMTCVCRRGSLNACARRQMRKEKEMIQRNQSGCTHKETYLVTL